MHHRISVAGVILREDQLLLVHHQRPGQYDFWLPPGGGLEDEESVFEGAEREVREETGLIVRAERLLYLQEILEPGKRIFKSFVLCSEIGGSLSLEHRVDDEQEFLVNARFFARDELVGMDVRPDVFLDAFWADRQLGFPEVRYLGRRRATS